VPGQPEPPIELGTGTGLMVSPIGVGAWSWGDKSGYWGYGETGENDKTTNRAAFDAAVESGLTFIDTAEARRRAEGAEERGASSSRSGRVRPSVQPVRTVRTIFVP